MDTQTPQNEKPVVTQPTQPASVAAKKKVKSRPAVVVLSVLLLLALVGAGMLGQIVYGQNQALESANELIARYSNENVQLKNAQTGSDASSVPSFDARTLVVSYDTLVEKRLTTTEKDKADIENSVKSALKVTSLPNGWEVLVVFPDAKATNNYPRGAIVYIPAAGTNAAQLLEFAEGENGKWSQNTYY